MAQGGNKEILDSERLLRSWRWLCPQSLTVIDKSAFGDLFLRDEAGGVHMLNVRSGYFTVVAESVPEFTELAKTPEKREEWFAEEAVNKASERGLVPGLDECIDDSAHIADLFEHVACLGDIHRLIRRAYFPPNTFAGSNPDLRTYRYSVVLSELDEPPLWPKSPDAEETWRFTYIGTWDSWRTVTLSIHANGAGSVQHKEVGAEQVLTTDRIEVSANKVIGFLEIVRRAEFWNAPTEIPSEGLDGSQWLLEGIKEGRYHLVTRWSPGFESQSHQILAFAEACRLLLEYAGNPFARGR